MLILVCWCACTLYWVSWLCNRVSIYSITAGMLGNGKVLWVLCHITRKTNDRVLKFLDSNKFFCGGRWEKKLTQKRDMRKQTRVQKLLCYKELIWSRWFISLLVFLYSFLNKQIKDFYRSLKGWRNFFIKFLKKSLQVLLLFFFFFVILLFVQLRSPTKVWYVTEIHCRIRTKIQGTSHDFSGQNSKKLYREN